MIQNDAAQRGHKKKRLDAKFKELGDDAVRSDLADGGYQLIGGTLEVRKYGDRAGKLARWLSNLGTIIVAVIAFGGGIPTLIVLGAILYFVFSRT